MKTIRYLLAVSITLAGTSLAQVPTHVSQTKPTEHIAFAADSTFLSGLSIRWRGNPTQDADDTDAGSQFNLCGVLPGAQLQALTVRIGQGQAGSFNPGARGLPLTLDFFAVDPETTNYASIFRADAIMPTNAAAADYLTFDLSSTGVILTNGTYAFMIGSNLEDADVTNEPHRFRLSVNTANAIAGCFEIRREGLFGVDPALGAPAPRPGPTVPPNIRGPEAREPVFFLQATVPAAAPAIASLDFSPAENTFTIQYQSEAGVVYNVRRSPVLDSDLAAWTELPPTAPGNGEVMAYTDTPPEGGAHFYALTGVASARLPDPLPLQNFETGAPGWTTSNPGGTVTQWELGQEAYLLLGAASGTNVWATGLDSFYRPGTTNVLRSPPLNLARYASAYVHWAQYRWFDDPSGDVGLVNVVDVTAGTTTTIHTATSVDRVFAWERLSAPLPASVMGHVVHLEFLFKDDGVDQFQGSPGWLIDDVAVTVCP